MISSLQSIILCVSLLAPAIAETPQKPRSGFKVREPNLHAPNLYADSLDFEAALIDLPGAAIKQSYWELSFQLYFIPEEQYYATLKRRPKGSYNPTPEEFQGRILLAEGHRKQSGLETLKTRTISLAGVPFKKKIPDEQRTKFAQLLTSYSVKILDARLNTTIYHSGVFFTQPFEANNRDETVARRKLYLNFSVNGDATLNYSQLSTQTTVINRRSN